MAADQSSSREPDDRIHLPLDPEEALRALLRVKPDDPPVDDEETPAE